MLLREVFHVKRKTSIPKSIKKEYEKSSRKKRSYPPLTPYIKKRLPAKIRIIKKEHPELDHDAVVARAIGYLRGKEKEGKY